MSPEELHLARARDAANLPRKNMRRAARYQTDEIYRQRHAARHVQLRWAKLGVTPDMAEMMLAAQDGRCPICRREIAIKAARGSGSHDGRACLDHDHVTMRARGFLRTSCNAGLGKFADSIDRLARAIAYLEKFVR